MCPFVVVQELRTHGKFRLDAISLVTKDELELSPAVVDELNVVTQLFGGDIKSNVLPIITFSEVIFDNH